MRKVACLFMTMLLAVPFFAGAVIWNGDSNQFRWLGTVTKSDKFLKASQISLRCVPDFAKGTVTMHYALPAAAKNAKLAVYSVSGALVQNFDLQTGSNALQWDYAKNKVAAGIYVASLRYGDVEKNIQLSLVK
jgi:hypothetical protein